LLLLDQAETLGIERSLSAWAKISGRSTWWVKMRQSEYLEHLASLRTRKQTITKRLPNGEVDQNANETGELFPSPEKKQTITKRLPNEKPDSHTILKEKQENMTILTPTPPPKPRRKPRTPPPETLPVDQLVTLRGWCDRECPGELGNLDRHVSMCLDHFRAKGEIRASWYSTIKNWVRNAEKWRMEREQNEANRDFDPTGNVVDAGIALLADYRKRSS
jgi:hypothetical protein